MEPQSHLLSTIDSPASLKAVSEDQLPTLAQEIREQLNEYIEEKCESWM